MIAKSDHVSRFAGHDGTFFIAEIGGNHEGNFTYAQELIQLALPLEVQGIKFQVYRTDNLVSPVADEQRYEHFKRFELKYEQFETLAQTCGKRFMASVWDLESLERMDPWIQVHKIGSGDLTNDPMLKAIAGKNKPLILSTAMSTLDEGRSAVAVIDAANPRLRKKGMLCIMHCVAMYGSPDGGYANLLAIRTLQNEFTDIPIGYSDHTEGAVACEVAIALGAAVVEKHFTSDKSRAFRDHAIAATAKEFENLLRKEKEIERLLGDGVKEPVAAVETPERIREFRRGVYLNKSAAAGHVLKTEDIVTLRPLVGIDARRHDDVIGRRLVMDKEAWEPLLENDLES